MKFPHPTPARQAPVGRQAAPGSARRQPRFGVVAIALSAASLLFALEVGVSACASASPDYPGGVLPPAKTGTPAPTTPTPAADAGPDASLFDATTPVDSGPADAGQMSDAKPG